MDPITVVYILAALLTKHLICDFPLQVPFHYLNKGTYGHPGGLAHAGIHVVGTFFVLCLFAPALAVYLALVDGIVHYHMDWAKMNINKHYGWKPDNSEYFWWLVGFDQWVHCMTYIGIVWYLV